MSFRCPRCGRGTIPAVFADRGQECEGSDIVDRGAGTFTHDFLADDYPIGSVDNIITNPPFNLAEKFAWKALDMAGNKVAILQRLAWLESKSRAKLFDDTCLARIWVFRRRVNMPPGGIETKGNRGSIPFAWYVWDNSHIGGPQLGWLE